MLRNHASCGRVRNDSLERGDREIDRGSGFSSRRLVLCSAPDAEHDKLPRSKQGAAKILLCAMPQAPTRTEAARLRDGFARRYRASYPEAVAILEKDWDALTTCYDLPQEHGKHLRTSNVVESPFAALRVRTGAAKRFKVKENATMLIWRVLRVVEGHFRKLDAPELRKDVYEGRRFVDGKPITRAIGQEAA